jgi:uncharacterized repeat protein (TIGR03803 family)
VLLLRLAAGPPAFVPFEPIRRRRLMQPKFLLLAFLILPSLAAQAQHHFRVLHAFGSGNDGAGVWDSVTLDAHGNVYGTTSGGGPYGGGTAFRLTLGSNGHWIETMLHNFGSGSDGAGPLGGLVLNAGNLYGTTQTYGKYDRGIAFRLAPAQGYWKETVLYNFCQKPDCEDGGDPWGSLIMDGKGALYGTGFVAFQLSPGLGHWSEKTLHNFTGNKGDGYLPQAGPIRDAAGDLYGTTRYGGGSKECDDGCGTVWELEPPSSDQDSGGTAWKEVILHGFGLTEGDGGFPGLGQLAMDTQGNLYGTTDSGGPSGAGTVFRLTRPTDGSADGWKETILHGFSQDQNGFEPSGGVILDGAVNLYGTTIAGGSSDCGCGVVFKLSPQTDGAWKYTLLHTFVGSDGAQPDANLTLGPDGKLYGTAASGGPHGGGVVFQLTP